jgi:site-specific recombinase XerD
MCYLLHRDTKKTFEGIRFIPFKKSERPLIHYFEHDDALKIMKSINIRNGLGFRDYTIITLLYDAGCRASEVCDIKITKFDATDRTLEIIGKGNKWRKVDLWPRTCQILEKYIKKSRVKPLPLYKDYLFINQRGSGMTRSGIYKLCQRHSMKPEGLRNPFPSAKIQAVHSWRHSSAINMIRQGLSILEVKTRLGHSSYETTARYLAMDLTIKRNSMESFVKFISQFIEEQDLATVAEWNQKQDVIDFIKSL